MTFQLTESQQQAVDSCGEKHVRAVDARNNSIYVLIPESDFRRIQEMLDEDARNVEIYKMAKVNAQTKIEEERKQKVIAKVALQNAIAMAEKVP